MQIIRAVTEREGELSVLEQKVKEEDGEHGFVEWAIL
jgi:hypothetical protein